MPLAYPLVQRASHCGLGRPNSAASEHFKGSMQSRSSAKDPSSEQAQTITERFEAVQLFSTHNRTVEDINTAILNQHPRDLTEFFSANVVTDDDSAEG